MSDFYSAYQSPPRDNTLTYVVIGLVVVILAVVVYFKYDDIVSLFESNDEYSQSSPASTSKKAVNRVAYDYYYESEESPSSEVEDDSDDVETEQPSTSSVPSKNASSSKAATSETTSNPASSKAASTIRWNNGTRDIGETCEKNEDCRSSDPFPLVCSEDEITQVKTCKKPNMAEDGIRASNCYVYQCNKNMNKSIDKTYTWFDDRRPSNYQEPCYNCEIRQWWYEGGHAKKYRLRPVAFYQMPRFADYPNVVDKEALYNKVCYKTGNTCSPEYQPNT